MPLVQALLLRLGLKGAGGRNQQMEMLVEGCSERVSCWWHSCETLPHASWKHLRFGVREKGQTWSENWWEIEFTLVKYTGGNPQMPLSDGGGLVGRSVMSVLGPN